MQPELSVPHSLVRVLTAGALALAAVFALAYVVLSVWRLIAPDTSNKQEAYTEQQKLNILAGLSGTTSLSDAEKKKMLKEMAGDTQVSEQQKADILKSLQQQ